MAEPALPNLYRVQVAFMGKSGLPEDAFVNTWWFRGTGAAENADKTTMLGEVAPQIEEFYTAMTAASQRVTDFMNSGIFQPDVQVKLYKMDEPTPREPVASSFTIPNQKTGGINLPAEVAAVMSFRSIIPGPRGKGRLYLGPLHTSALSNQEGPTTGYSVLSAAFRDCVAERAEALIGRTVNLAQWVQCSRASLAISDVTAGWIDDAPDIVRRRGVRPSVRTTFGTGYVLAA